MLFISKLSLPLSLLLASFATTITVESDSGELIIDTGGGLRVTFDSDNCDMTSIEYKGTNYQSQSAYSHLASGLGSDASVEYYTIGTL
jgi:rhamnogalacturonan endolyase